MDRLLSRCCRKDEPSFPVENAELFQPADDASGDREQVRNRIVPAALRIRQLQCLRLRVVVIPRRPQELEEPLASEQDLAADRLRDFRLLQLQPEPTSA